MQVCAEVLLSSQRGCCSRVARLDSGCHVWAADVARRVMSAGVERGPLDVTLRSYHAAIREPSVLPCLVYAGWRLMYPKALTNLTHLGVAEKVA
jgi:hypothetical protein